MKVSRSLLARFAHCADSGGENRKAHTPRPEREREYIREAPLLGPLVNEYIARGARGGAVRAGTSYVDQPMTERLR